MIKVAIRVKPFHRTDYTNTLCIDMPSDTSLVVKDMEGDADQVFEYEHCLWSFDQETRKYAS